MIKLKFKTKKDEIEFFKRIHVLSEVFGFNIRYAEMISDLDIVESEKEDE